MNEFDFRRLVEKYAAGELLEAEQKQFFELIESEEYRKILEQILEFEWREGTYEETGNPEVYSVLESHVLKAINEPPVEQVTPGQGAVVYFKKYWLAIAAVLIIMISTAILVFQKKAGYVKPGIATKNQTQKTEILPATNGAILTLGNGQQIVLDSIGSGLVANQGNSSIVKQNNGLAYQASGTGSTDPVYNTISTPKGRQYPNLTLSDGTKVWLDAGSSIRFPVAFVGNERKVEISGQVWFDVVHNSQMPFKVIAKGVETTDIGTEFNVNAYEDENDLKVTLLQGAIQINGTVIKPGEQALVDRDGSLRLNKNADLDEVMAWKTGYFNFNKADIQTIMKQLSRWYDVDVSYTGKIPAGTYSGKISRNLGLQDLLDGLAFSDIRFRIDGRKLIVLP